MTQPFQMQELKEPFLVSQATKSNEKKGFLNSYLQSLYPSRFKSTKEEQPEEDKGEYENDQNSKERQDQSTSNYVPTDFAEKADDVIDRISYENKHLTNFYHQATAIHELPAQYLPRMAIYKNDPSIFACIATSSKMFKDIDLKEFIQIEDYKKLTRLRVNNYIAILQMLTKIDSGLYSEVKQKLYQIQALTKFLELKYEKLYERLHADRPIHDFDVNEESEPKPADEADKDKESQKKQEGEEAESQEGEKEKDAEENEDEDEYDEEEEQEAQVEQDYEDYYKQSDISYPYSYSNSFSFELNAEEEKWESRADWLETIIKRLNENEQTKRWVSWFNAKMDSLAELDIPVKNVTDNSNDQIYYLYKALEEEIMKDSTREEYSKDQQVYVEPRDFYPEVQTKASEASNSFDYGTISKSILIREKLCRRIKNREEQTDFFLTVFKKKPFGNEKIYERRINVRHHEYKVSSVQFNQLGNYVHIRLEITASDYTTRPFDLIFSLLTQYKEPYILKKGDEPMFFKDNSFFAYHAYTTKIRKLKPKQEKDDEDESEEEEEEEKKSQEEQQEEEKEPSKQAEEDKESEQEQETNQQEAQNEENQEAEKEEKPEEEEYEEEEVTTYKIHEYELDAQVKLKTYDLSTIDRKDDILSDLSNYTSQQADNQFGKYRDGIYMIRTNYDSEYKNKVVDIYLKTEKTMEKFASDPNEKFGTNLKVQINERGDKAIVIFAKGEQIVVNQYNLDLKEKKLKKEKELKVIGDVFTYESDKIEFCIYRDFNDFIFAFKPQQKETYFFQNDNYWTKMQIENIEHISVNSSPEKNADKIVVYEDTTQFHDKVKYKIFHDLSQNSAKKDYQWENVEHNIFNQQQILCFPYVCFIYNHDQVFIKDLTKDDKKGFYYMNSFMGINKNLRPLTVYAHTYRSMLNLTVPTINNGYSGSDFVLRMHQVKTRNKRPDFYKIKNLVKFNIYMFNQELVSLMGQKWFETVADKNLKIFKDIRIFSKHNSLYIERWEKGRCISRIIYAQYHNSNDKYQDFLNENEYGQEYKNETFWMVIVQKLDVISLYSRELYKYNYISESMGQESVWDFANDEQNNDIYNVLVDNLTHGKVDINVVFKSGLMRRFSSANTSNLKFEEHLHSYSFEGVFKDKVLPTNTKIVNLFDQYQGDMFVANQIFYANFAIIDLNAQNFLGQVQLGYHLNPTILNTYQDFYTLSYSFNEAKMGQVVKSGYQYDIKMKLAVHPLVNTRQLPLFHHKQFIHPIVPQIDKERGFTSVFTLTLGIQSQVRGYQNHEKQKQILMSKLINTRPGLLIRYFNGIEHQIPMSDYNEDFTEIIRFKQSRDGKFAIIVGERKGKLEDRFLSQTVNEADYHKGIFLYKVGLTEVKLLKAFLFAEKDPNFAPESVKDRLSLEPKTVGEYHKPEINKRTLGEYGSEQISADGEFESQRFIFKVDYKDHDDEYVDKLKKDQFENRKARLLKQKEEERKKAQNKRSLIADLDEGLTQEEQDQQLIDEVNAMEKIEGEEDFRELTRLSNLVFLFENFDIPYLDQTPEAMYQIAKEESDQLLIKSVEQPVVEKTEGEEAAVDRYETAYHKRKANLFEDDEQEKIKTIHHNMLLDVNELGLIFLVNRLNNKLYLFYERAGDHKLIQFRFDKTFPVKGVDASYDEVTKKYYLLVWSSEGYQVIDITLPLTEDDYRKKYQQAELGVIFKSKDYETQGVKKEIVGSDEYKYTIKSCYMSGCQVILWISESESECLKIFNVEKKAISYYIEEKMFLVSGDKNFLWIQGAVNQVFDIKHDLATFFIWPGDQTENMMFHDLDLFNVTEDRTLMTTQGFIQQAFNMISYIVQTSIDKLDFTQAIEAEEFPPRFTKQINYMYYKISDYKSIIETIFMEDFDKLPKHQYENGFKAEKQEEEEQVVEQPVDNKEVELSMKQLQTLLKFVVNLYDPKKHNVEHLSNFFLTYYKIDKQDEKVCCHQSIFQKLFSKEKRVDIVDDILVYIVESKKNPIVQRVINKSFVEFLSFADISKPFQTYLTNITHQTYTMTQTEKFQIPSTDLGYIVEAHDSPIMDDRFFTKFKKIEESKQDVDIKYIKLDDLLGDNGEEIMEMLSDKKYIDLMAIPFIQYVVMFQWQKTQSSIKNKLLYPFVLLLAFFTIWCFLISFSPTVDLGNEVITTTNDTIENGGTFTNVTDSSVDIAVVVSKNNSGSNFGLYYLSTLALLLNIFYFFYIEFKQLIKSGKEYFSSLYNFADLVSYSLCFLVVVLYFSSISNDVTRPIASITLIILWIKMFYFLRVFDTTARLIRMIFEIVKDMGNFMIVLVIGIFAFTCGFYVLQQGVGDMAVYVEGGGSLPGDYFQSFIYSYRLANGDFDYGFFADLPTADYYLAWFLFVFGSLFLIIVLLNLLIAIMGDTFGRVLGVIQNMTIQEKVMLVSENENLFERKQIFQQSQYLIIISEKSLEGGQAETTDQLIGTLKKDVLDKVQTLQTDLDTKITENQKELKIRIVEQEERQKKQSAALEVKIQGLFKTEFESVISKISDQFKVQSDAQKNSDRFVQEQSRVIKGLFDNLESIRLDQNKMKQNIYKSLKIQDEQGGASDEE